MAKKAAKPAKKRKAEGVAPKEAEEGKNIGTIAVSVQTVVTLAGDGLFDELVIELGTLGLSEEPDRIVETSGNNRLLDPKRPITTSEEGVHLFFSPPLNGAGVYGFQLQCIYNDAVEARTAAPPKSEDADSEHTEAAF